MRDRFIDICNCPECHCVAPRLRELTEGLGVEL